MAYYYIQIKIPFLSQDDQSRCPTTEPATCYGRVTDAQGSTNVPVTPDPDRVTDIPVTPGPDRVTDIPVTPSPGRVTDVPVTPSPGRVTDVPVTPGPGGGAGKTTAIAILSVVMASTAILLC